MKETHFTYRFSVSKLPEEVFAKVCRVSEWWTTDIEGSPEKLHDEFTVRFGESFVKMEVTDMIPEKKIIWLVKDSYWSFLHHKTEWNGTEIVWNISAAGSCTQVSLIHIGLVPGKECFEICNEGWGLYAGNSLFRLITENEGIPFEKSK